MINRSQSRSRLWGRLLATWLVGVVVHGVRCEPSDYFGIQVVDSRTKRGVPLVELRTTANHLFVTDSNGYVAFNEPGLMDRSVFFHVQSHGYQFPKDGFGYAGQALATVPGTVRALEIDRVNLAERLYRTTGFGVYRDSVLLGKSTPVREPVLNAQVTGSDSVQMERYRGKLHWFWGDTNRPRYPLGNFHTPGASSLPPSQGGLDPSDGIDLDYFVDGQGFAAGTAQMGEQGFTWLSGLMVVPDPDGGERMYAHFVQGVSDPQTMWRISDRGVMRWNDGENRFERVATWGMDGPFPNGAHTLLHDGHVYFCDPFPRWRVRARHEDIVDQSKYESFSCLPEGTRAADAETTRTEFSWKRNTATPAYGEALKASRNGQPPGAGHPWRMVDAATDEEILPHRGSVAWNEFRQRWIMIFGISPDLGQIYYSEAKELSGPWTPSRRIITHDRYSFYNPVHHPELDQQDGRLIYLEGTYTTSFSSAPMKTPYYDYNQVMYRLDLSDPRLGLQAD